MKMYVSNDTEGRLSSRNSKDLLEDTEGFVGRVAAALFAIGEGAAGAEVESMLLLPSFFPSLCCWSGCTLIDCGREDDDGDAEEGEES